MYGAKARLGLQQLHPQMRHCALARCSIAPGVASLQAGFEEVLRRARVAGLHGQHRRRGGQQRHRRQILQRVVRRLGVKQFGNGEVAIDHQTYRVTVRRFGHHISRDVAAGARAVVHDHGLPQSLGQRLGQCARRQVWAGATRKTNNDTDGLGGPWHGDRTGLRPSQLPGHGSSGDSPTAPH